MSIDGDSILIRTVLFKIPQFLSEWTGTVKNPIVAFSGHGNYTGFFCSNPFSRTGFGCWLPSHFRPIVFFSACLSQFYWRVMWAKKRFTRALLEPIKMALHHICCHLCFFECGSLVLAHEVLNAKDGHSMWQRNFKQSAETEHQSGIFYQLQISWCG